MDHGWFVYDDGTIGQNPCLAAVFATSKEVAIARALPLLRQKQKEIADKIEQLHLQEKELR